MVGELGPFAQQPVAARGHRLVDAAGKGPDRSALVRRPARGDQRARSAGGLDHQHAPGQPRNEPVAQRKVVAARGGARPELGEQKPPVRQAFAELAGGPGAIDAAAQDGQRVAADLERRRVRRLVHPARETGDDDRSTGRELGREVARHRHPVGAGRARSHDGHADPIRPEELEPAPRPEPLGGGVDRHQLVRPAVRPGRERVDRPVAHGRAPAPRTGPSGPGLAGPGLAGSGAGGLPSGGLGIVGGHASPRPR